MIQVQYYQSPYGELILGSFEGKLCMCDWVNEKRREVIDKRLQKALHADYCTQGSEVIAKAILQLEEYFARKRKAFDIPLLFIGTDFQKSVWQELLNIPYGKTVTYAELASAIAERRGLAHMSAQAVGGAVGHNPISIIIPCHRVVGSGGSLTGYAGGIDRKIRLLSLEGADMSGLYVPAKGTAL